MSGSIEQAARLRLFRREESRLPLEEQSSFHQFSFGAPRIRWACSRSCARSSRRNESFACSSCESLGRRGERKEERKRRKRERTESIKMPLNLFTLPPQKKKKNSSPSLSSEHQRPRQLRQDHRHRRPHRRRHLRRRPHAGLPDPLAPPRTHWDEPQPLGRRRAEDAAALLEKLL